ncbi:MAG: hypothetical protein ACK4LT_00920 [Aquificaceae bacterium]
MDLRRIIKIKEGIKDLRSKELKEIDMQINLIKKEIQQIDAVAEEINNLIKSSFSEGLLLRYRAILSKKKDLLNKLKELKRLKEERKERLKEAYKDIKALEILKENFDRIQRLKTNNLEAQNVNFMHLIKRWYENA